MFEILFLGTSASAPSAKRGLAAQIIKHDEYRFLIDCGEGTQRQILQSGTGFKNLTRILLTHGHLDHILGLGGLLSSFLGKKGEGSATQGATAQGLASMLDLDGDGNPLDDILNTVRKVIS